MTNSPKLTEKSKQQHGNIKNTTKKFDYTTIADRLRTVSWSNSSHPTGVVRPVYERSTFPLTAKSSVINRTWHDRTTVYITNILSQLWIHRTGLRALNLPTHRKSSVIIRTWHNRSTLYITNRLSQRWIHVNINITNFSFQSIYTEQKKRKYPLSSYSNNLRST